MNLLNKVFLLALLLFQRPCWKLSAHRKASKYHGVSVLEPRPWSPTEWIWLSKMAQVGARGLWRFRRCGCIADAGRSPWSEGCLASDCNLKRLLAPEDRDVHFVTWWSPWTALRWGRCERGLFPARAFSWSICGLGRLRKCRREKKSPCGYVAFSQTLPESLLMEWANTHRRPVRPDILMNEYWLLDRKKQEMTLEESPRFNYVIVLCRLSPDADRSHRSVILQLFWALLEQILPSTAANPVRADSSPQKRRAALWLIMVKEAKLVIILGIFAFWFFAVEVITISTKLGCSL